MKTCSTCGEEKPLDAFARRRDSTDGRRGQCQDCRKGTGSEYQAAYYRANKDRVQARHREHYAANRDRVKGQYAEYRERTREQRRQRNREYYSENREEIAERRAERYWVNWPWEYRRRMARFGLEITEPVEEFTRDDVIQRYGDRCYHCGVRPFEELDHYPIPVRAGGPHTRENVKPACIPCNRKKMAR